MKAFRPLMLCGLLTLVAPHARGGDRLEWTGAVTQIEGAAGGGLVPFALIAGLETNREVGATAFVTYVSTSDFSLKDGGVNVGFLDRVELSFARQRFDAGSVLPGLTLGQDVIGAKVRVAGDAVFAPDSFMPQVALGAQWKRTLDFNQIPQAVGASKGRDVDLYLAATKVYFAALAGHNVILDLTLRRTSANQFGLLGFGGNGGGYRLEPEASAGLWLHDEVLLGAEYRDKHSDLRAFDEQGAYDAFLAYAPLKNVSFTAAFVDLGRIAGKSAQAGFYLSAWAGL